MDVSLALWILVGIASTVIMMAASRFALRHAVVVAEKLRLPPFLVGVSLVALGTDAPGIVNSLVSCYLGHGGINLGDSIGSVFPQGSLGASCKSSPCRCSWIIDPASEAIGYRARCRPVRRPLPFLHVQIRC